MSINTFNLYDLFERNATIFPEREALVFHDESTTFKSLLVKINNLAGTFKAKDLKKGDRIAILALNRLEFFVIFGAAARLGAILVPINWRLSAREIDYILHDTTPTLMFISPDYQEVVLSLLAKHGYIKEVVLLAEPGRGDIVPFAEFVKEKEYADKTEVEDDDPFLIVHTAAITGQPLGAVLTHSNILASNMQYMYLMNLSEENIYLNTLHLFHMAGLTLAMAVLHAGGKNVVIPRFDPQDTLKAIEEKQVTIMGSFPPILSQLLEAMAESDYDISSLRHIRGIEDKETIYQFKEKSKAEFWAAYGQTETAGAVAICPYFERIGSAGKCSPISRIRIVDEYDRPVEPNVQGEIVIRGAPCV